MIGKEGLQLLRQLGMTSEPLRPLQRSPGSFGHQVVGNHLL
jgi:hypothetical protein